MRALLLAAAASLTAIILPITPAQALDPAGMGFTSSSASGVTVHRGAGVSHRRGGFTVGDDSDRNRNRRSRSDVEMVNYGGEWALYNNRSWQSDSYNDWWHDQPWRSYPKWVSTNQNCERMWWSGGGWRC